eukprot:3761813-Amphidinium_carterae.3
MRRSTAEHPVLGWCTNHLVRHIPHMAVADQGHEHHSGLSQDLKPTERLAIDAGPCMFVFKLPADRYKWRQMPHKLADLCGTLASCRTRDTPRSTTFKLMRRRRYRCPNPTSIDACRICLPLVVVMEDRPAKVI